MKKLIFIFVAGLSIFGTSCKKYLDINDNPNSATTVVPSLVLPQALAYTANTMNGFNNYGSQTGLYMANAGGYGGFGEAITYNFTTSNTGLFNTSYDNLEDYQYVLNTTDGDHLNTYFNAAARIMKCYHFQNLVDAFDDVPYFEALQGDKDLTPAYDQGEAIYKDLGEQLDKAIADINEASADPLVTDLGSADIVFGGDMDMWKKFATTIKLRLMIRAGSKVTFTSTDLSEGFITEDALINPGYTRDNGKQNPLWNQWAFSYTGTTGNRSWMPSQFIFGFYHGEKLQDSLRGKATYYDYPETGYNRLGVENNQIPSSPTGSFWYASDDRTGASAGNASGILKGPSAGYPIMLAAESYFLQAEGAMRGYISGDVKTLFDAGVKAAFTYDFMKEDGSSIFDVNAAIAQYKIDNGFSYLVNFNLASTDAQKLEAIITQKFIANNMIRGEETWNEYRRTHYPAVDPAGDGFDTFASSVSESTRPDKLPTRILYPTSEGSSNSGNVPTGISPFSTLIFWAL